MRHLILLCVSTLLFCCGSGDTPSGRGGAPSLEDVLTFELAFGDDESLGEYLLARPVGFDVLSDGSSAILDEYRIKVFDASGRPKTLLGGKGQGPGEIGFMYSLSVSHSDLLTVVGDRTHVYDADNNILSTVNFFSDNRLRDFLRNNNFFFRAPQRIVALNQKKLLYPLDVSLIDPDTQQRNRELLIIEEADTIRALSDYPNVSLADLGQGQAMLPFLGILHYAELSGSRIAVTHPAHDVTEENGREYYHIQIIDLNTGSEESISHPFNRMQIVPDDYSMYRAQEQDAPNDFIGIIEEYLKKFSGWAPVQELLGDGAYLFVVTSEPGDSSTFMTDVFDVNSGEYAGSFFLPAHTRPLRLPAIRNGYAYYLNDFRHESEFPRIEKYPIDPAVYGKKK